MLDEKTIIATIEQLVKSHNVSSYFRCKILDAINPDIYTISWCVEDMEHLAKQYEDDDTLYDREEFAYALEMAIDNHDANYGVSWDTLYHYLEEYCRIEENK